MLTKWKKATLNIEVTNQTLGSFERHAAQRANLNRLRAGEITEEQWKENFIKAEKQNQKIKFAGSAIFVLYRESHFLVTARHVVQDHHRQESNERAISASDDPRIRDYLSSTIEIVSNITVNPRIDSFPPDDLPIFIGNLQSGPSRSRSYTISNSDLDLAVISLSTWHKEFAHYLYERGYKPIPESDFCDKPQSEGEELTCVGFPALGNALPNPNFGGSQTPWTCALATQPIFTFGRVAFSHEAFPWILGDISIHEGNSGGAAICNDKLAGIVTHQAEAGHDGVFVPLPFAYITKSKYILDLLEFQYQKDLQLVAMRGPF